MERNVKATNNVLAGFMFEIIALFCNLLIPGLIIANYGSAANGMVSSVTQLLTCSDVFQAGIISAALAALYKPLANKDNLSISKIYNQTKYQNKKLGIVFLIIVVIFAAIYPMFVSEYFSRISVFLLVIVISATTFISSYFEITNIILLQADQKYNIVYIIKTLATVLNICVVYFLIKSGFSLLIVKMGTALVYNISPVFLHFYVKKKYIIQRKTVSEIDYIKHRWIASTHGISELVLMHADIVILTLLSDVKTLSVYTIYSSVVYALTKMPKIFKVSFSAMIGDMYAKGEFDAINETIGVFETVIFFISTVIFSSVLVMIVPFAMLYTSGVYDISYNEPLFSTILVISQCFYCFKIPYHSVAMSVGHFSQTKNVAIVEIIIKIIASIILFSNLGLVGVALGSLAVTVYQSFIYAHYLSRNIIYREFKIFLKRVIISIICMFIIYLISRLYINMSYSIFGWIISGAITTVIGLILNMLTSIIFFNNDFQILVGILKSNLKKK